MLKRIPAIPTHLYLDESVPEIRLNVGVAGLTQKGNIHSTIKLWFTLHSMPNGMVTVQDKLEFTAALASITTLFNQLLFQFKEIHT
jgi:hypothetical protein